MLGGLQLSTNPDSLQVEGGRTFSLKRFSERERTGLHVLASLCSRGKLPFLATWELDFTVGVVSPSSKRGGAYSSKLCFYRFLWTCKEVPQLSTLWGNSLAAKKADWVCNGFQKSKREPHTRVPLLTDTGYPPQPSGALWTGTAQLSGKCSRSQDPLRRAISEFPFEESKRLLICMSPKRLLCYTSSYFFLFNQNNILTMHTTLKISCVCHIEIIELFKK